MYQNETYLVYYMSITLKPIQNMGTSNALEPGTPPVIGLLLLSYMLVIMLSYAYIMRV